MAKKKKTQRTTKQALAVAKDTKKNVGDRIQSLTEVSGEICTKKSVFDAIIDVLTDVDEEFAVREEALVSLQSASFSVVDFEQHHSAYIAALRKVSKGTDQALCEQALEILAAQKDGQTQRSLLKGLKDPKKAKIAPERALQLLGYDAHSDAYDVAKELVKNPPSDVVKREALRLLSSDSTAAKIFSKLLRDKKESFEIRQLCASALHSLEPKTLYKYAKQIVVDKADSDELRATCLSALTHFGDELTDKDSKLLEQVKGLKEKASSKLKKRARAFLDRFGDN